MRERVPTLQKINKTVHKMGGEAAVDFAFLDLGVVERVLSQFLFRKDFTRESLSISDDSNSTYGEFLHTRNNAREGRAFSSGSGGYCRERQYAMTWRLLFCSLSN